MAQRETAAVASKRTGAGKRGNTKRGGPQTAEQKKAAAANLAKGRAARDAQRSSASAQDRDDQKTRWAKLLDGTLTVRDLDDDEIDAMRVKGKDGAFNGRAPRNIPSHLAHAFLKERVRRAEGELQRVLLKAVRRLETVIDDPDAKDSDAINASRLVVERVMGKAEQKIILGDESQFDRLSREAAGQVDLDREMADLQGDD